MSQQKHAPGEAPQKVAGVKGEVLRLWHASHHSWDGIRAAFKGEKAFRLECLLAVPLILIACLIEVSPLERALLIASVLAVLCIELLNSAIEATVDLVTEARHPLAKKAKDCASAAVLLSLLGALAVWIGVLL